MENKFDLTGRVALVTGAGRGIGQEIARTLAAAGADIAIAELDAASGEETATQVRTLGRRSSAVQMNVMDLESVRSAVAAVIAEYGQIDILVNNAGICFNVTAQDTTLEQWRRMMGINLDGVWFCCQEVGRHMLERGKGSIVNIASMSGLVVNNPQPQSAYNISKAGVIMLTQCLAAEWAMKNVRVNAVSPGYVNTEMTRRGMDTPEWAKTWMDFTPVRRLGEPWEIAHAVWYLASDASGFAVGSNLVIDGGYTIW